MPLGPPDSCMVLPWDTGELEDAVATGFALTTTLVLAVPVDPPELVTVKV